MNIAAMKRGLIYTILGLLVLAAATVSGPLRERIGQVVSDVKRIGADTGDVMSSATYQRYAMRRKAVASMRTSLLGVARAESVAVLQTGRPEAFNLGRYRFTNDPANQIYINIQRDRWVAQAKNIHTSMSCSLTAVVNDPSATNWTYRPGQPICAEWNAESTAVMAAAAKASRAAEARATAVAAAASTVAESQAVPAPRPRHDWGPVNNTSPPLPYIVNDACEGEGCVASGTWAACSTIVAVRDKRADGSPAFAIQPGERFTAVTAEIDVIQTGMVVFRRPFTTTVSIDEVGPVDLTFTPADTLILLNYIGEGETVWRFRGNTMRGDMFWDNDELVNATDTVGLARRAKTVWWVRVRNGGGQEGWIIGDYGRMATGGYMDELERCLHSPKG